MDSNPVMGITPSKQARWVPWAAVFVLGLVLPLLLNIFVPPQLGRRMQVLDAAQPTQLARAQEPYTQTWQYRYGDSPKGSDGQAPLWAQAAVPEGTFKDAPYLTNPPGRDGQRWLWLRTRLAGPMVPRSMLYLMTVDQIFEAYLDGELVYRFGEFTGPQALQFAGYLPHLVPLPTAYQGRTLALRIYSSHINIGVSGPQRIGDTQSLWAETLRQDAGPIQVALVMMTIGLATLALAVGLRQRSDPQYLFYGSYAQSIGVWILCQAQSRSLLWPQPLAWVHIEVFAMYIGLTMLAFYLCGVFANSVQRRTLRLLRLLSWLLLLYDVAAAGLVGTKVVGVLATLLPFQMLLLVVMVLTMVMGLRAAWRGDTDARIFMAGFLLAASVGIYDVLTAISVLQRTRTAFGHLGQGAFCVCIGVILARRFLRVYLERGVAEQRLSEQASLLEAAARMAHGDLQSPIRVEKSSSLQPLASGLDAMRKDLQAKVRILEERNTEIQQLNDELRRQIEQRSRQMIEMLLDDESVSHDEVVPILPPGYVLAERYEIVAVLGQGAMGTVYEVQRTTDRRHLATKVLGGRLSKTAIARFAREAQLLAKLKHPNLISIVDADVTDKHIAYIVMELVRGDNLAALQNKYGDLSFVLPILQQVADALATVHAGGVVHRDLKPADTRPARSDENRLPRGHLGRIEERC